MIKWGNQGDLDSKIYQIETMEQLWFQIVQLCRGEMHGTTVASDGKSNQQQLGCQ